MKFCVSCCNAPSTCNEVVFVDSEKEPRTRVRSDSIARISSKRSLLQDGSLDTQLFEASEDYDFTDSSNILPFTDEELLGHRCTTLMRQIGRLAGVVAVRRDLDEDSQRVVEHYEHVLEVLQAELAGIPASIACATAPDDKMRALPSDISGSIAASTTDSFCNSEETSGDSGTLVSGRLHFDSDVSENPGL